MRIAKSLLLASSLFATSTVAAEADIKVVASIKPVHSLVAAVMEGVGTPSLVVKGADSPHTYSLKPSQAAMLEQADVVFWIGHELELFLEKPLEAIATRAKKVELMDAHGLEKLGYREGGTFEKHGHGEHEGHEQDSAQGERHDHAKDAHESDDGHDEHAHDDGHQHGEHDPHIWLDPVNAMAMVHEIEKTLAERDPANAAIYETNAHAVVKKLDALAADIAADLQPVKGKRFIVFHDAYHYFEHRFGLEAAGSITVSPEVMPGAERISEIRDRISHLEVACVFTEPQFEPKLVKTVTEGSNAQGGVLDPLGAGIEDGPDLYFNLLRGMARSIKSCLGEVG